MSTKVGTVLMTYDINHSHSEVKNALLQMGYQDFWIDRWSTRRDLPNTTVKHKAKSTDQAINDLRAAARNAGVTLQKAVAVLATDFAGV